jgi:hypothetical protein
VYKAFIAEMWEAEAKRLLANWPADLPPDYDAPLSYTNYCTDLAVEMFAREQFAVECTMGVYLRGGVGNSPWARFFSDDAVTQASLQGTRLRRHGRLYSFTHKSIPEYFAARAMWQDVKAVAAEIVSARAAGVAA